jgi:hypothetical protein
MIYAMTGMFFGLIAFYNKIKIADARKFLLFIVCTVSALSISYFKHNSNFLVHICSLSIGFILSLPVSINKNKKEKDLVE